MARIVPDAFRNRCTGKMKSAVVFLKRNFWRILYYAGVVLALCLIGSAAHEIRDKSAEAMNLNGIQHPSVEAGSIQQEESTKFVFPSGYDMMRTYSQHPQWNADIGCWQSHPAADYKSKDGLAVSMSEGLVTDIGKDALLGGFVLVETGEYRLCYASVEPDSGLQIGSRVEAGEVIGKMDVSMPGERYMGSHLHLEIYENGKASDPAEIFMKSAEEDLIVSETVL